MAGAHKSMCRFRRIASRWCRCKTSVSPAAEHVCTLALAELPVGRQQLPSFVCRRLFHVVSVFGMWVHSAVYNTL